MRITAPSNPHVFGPHAEVSNRDDHCCQAGKPDLRCL